MKPKYANNMSKDSFTALSNLIADLVVIINTEGKLVAVNQSFAEATCFRQQDLIGKKLL
jgi:PAS domain S-box-containing protein